MSIPYYKSTSADSVKPARLTLSHHRTDRLSLAAAALFSRTWRKPLAALLCTGAAGFLALVAVNAIDSALLSHYPALWTSHFFRHYGAMLIFRSSLLIVAIVCARMHKLLLAKPSSEDYALADSLTR